MSGLTPSREIHRRHIAAMTIVKELDADERVLLLGYVVAGSPWLRRMEADAEVLSSARHRPCHASLRQVDERINEGVADVEVAAVG